MMKELLLLLFSLLLCVPAFAADEKTGAAKTQSTVSAAAPAPSLLRLSLTGPYASRNIASS